MYYPKYIEVDGERFAIDTDYRTAIRCFEVIEDKTIDDYERAMAIIYLLLDDIPQGVNLQRVTELLLKYLSCGEIPKRKTLSHKKDMDLQQDERYIVASFMSDYQIDLSTAKLHWWHFCNLLNGLTGDCVLSRVREIRTCDLSIYRGKSRQAMEKAKKALALKEKVTDDDREAMEKFDKLFDVGGNVSSKNELDEDDEFLD